MPLTSAVLDWLLLAAFAALLAWLGAAAIRPWLIRYATAHPNSRSSHTTPTPQGGGVAVVLAVTIACIGAVVVGGGMSRALLVHAAAVGLGALGLMVVGLLDDIRGMPITVRLAAQAIAVGAVVTTLPPELRIAPDHLPLVAERVLLFVGGLWFVNLYNFMDGIDLMSVTETIAIGIGVIVLALLGLVPMWLGVAAAALAGAMLGFAPSNFPPARLFLGDAGSIAIGLVTGTLLVHVAASSSFVAALLLPLYYGMDASVTVIRRTVRERNFWTAHRQHFYQRAMGNGFSVARIISTIAALDATLVVLAVIAARSQGYAVALLTLAVGTIATIGVLRLFLRGAR